MKKIALIDHITENTIYASYNRSEEKSHAKAFIKLKEDFAFKVDNAKNILLQKGDSVEIFIEPKSAITMTFFMFIMPLIMFIIFYSLAAGLTKNGPEAVNIILGISGIGLSFLATYGFVKIRPQKLPVITRKVSSVELSASCSTGSGCGSCSNCS